MTKEKLYFIVNEKSKSGNGNSIWTQVENYLNANNIEYNCWRTEYQGHAAIIADEISRIDEPEKKVIIIGGDGTINEVINGMTDFERMSIGVIPNGSGNDFVRGVKIERNPIKYIKNVVLKNSVQRIDLGEVRWNGCEQPRLFGISAGMGMDAIVSKKTNESNLKTILNKVGLGKLTYIFMTIYTLCTMETVNGTLFFNGENRSVKKIIFVAAMNCPYEGGGVPIAPGANAKDGLLSVCCAADISRLKTFFYLPLLVLAKHTNMKKIKLFDTEELRCEFEKPVVLHTDGEYCDDVTEVTVRCLKEKLKFLI